MWLRAEGFLERVRSWWAGYGVVGTPSHSLASKLRFLKKILKFWNKEVFGNLAWRKNRVLSEIADFDKMESQGLLTVPLKRRRAECQAEFAEIAVMEEISWRQKSRALWLKKGDNNTNFFHRLANAHRRAGWCPLLDGLHFDSISGEELEEPFSEEEVFSALKSYNGDKAPGPDGYSMRFLLECWEVVREEVMGSFHAFHVQGSFEKSLNATFIALIPKKGEAMDV
ncbi:uncharacterized protein LOC132272953 [Cornus florida]|uniref:uncharacterized protein LOC132272953 n=1 Tax=Cornus florida TaxID=4283 RepID=UPI002899BECB|nr:uncharacterized protein LOC132272953 [Cornus florida]